jgi:hypothetical protein
MIRCLSALRSYRAKLPAAQGHGFFRGALTEGVALREIAAGGFQGPLEVLDSQGLTKTMPRASGDLLADARWMQPGGGGTFGSPLDGTGGVGRLRAPPPLFFGKLAMLLVKSLREKGLVSCQGRASWQMTPARRGCPSPRAPAGGSARKVLESAALEQGRSASEGTGCVVPSLALRSCVRQLLSMIDLIASTWRPVAGASFRAGRRNAGGVAGWVGWGDALGFVTRCYHTGDAGQCQGMPGSATCCREGVSRGRGGLEGVVAGGAPGGPVSK